MTGRLHAVWGHSPTDVYACGDGGAMVHYDGTAWSRVISGTTRELSGAYGIGGDEILVVGTSGAILRHGGR